MLILLNNTCHFKTKKKKKNNEKITDQKRR